MFYERKVKDHNWVYMLLIPVSIIGTFGLSAIIFGVTVGLYAAGGLILLYACYPLLSFIKTRNTGLLIQTGMLVSEGLLCVIAPSAINRHIDKDLILPFVVVLYAFLIMTAYHAFNRKTKFRGREVFELAAMPVEDTGSTYTARPRPTGQASVSQTEMMRFVDFATRNLVAFTFIEDHRVVFVPALAEKEFGYILGFNDGYENDTWVAISYDGQVSVNMTQKDYLLFKRDYDFDQLCESLGNVFVEFLELSKAGQESRIIDKMNALRLPLFS